MGGYLNLNESFAQTFGSKMKNLNESKKENELFFYRNPGISKLINFEDFKEFCDYVKWFLADFNKEHKGFDKDYSDAAFDINDNFPQYEGIVFDAAWNYGIQFS